MFSAPIIWLTEVRSPFFWILILVNVTYFKISLRNITNYRIRDALRALVPFVKFKKRKKHPRRSAAFIKVAGCAKHYIF